MIKTIMNYIKKLMEDNPTIVRHIRSAIETFSTSLLVLLLLAFEQGQPLSSALLISMSITVLRAMSKTFRENLTNK